MSKEQDAVKLLEEAFTEKGMIGVVWSRDLVLGPHDELVTSELCESLSLFVEGTGIKLLILERREADAVIKVFVGGAVSIRKDRGNKIPLPLWPAIEFSRHKEGECQEMDHTIDTIIEFMEKDLKGYKDEKIRKGVGEIQAKAMEYVLKKYLRLLKACPQALVDKPPKVVDTGKLKRLFHQCTESLLSGNVGEAAETMIYPEGDLDGISEQISLYLDVVKANMDEAHSIADQAEKQTAYIMGEVRRAHKSLDGALKGEKARTPSTSAESMCGDCGHSRWTCICDQDDIEGVEPLTPPNSKYLHAPPPQKKGKKRRKGPS